MGENGQLTIDERLLDTYLTASLSYDTWDLGNKCLYDLIDQFRNQIVFP